MLVQEPGETRRGRDGHVARLEPRGDDEPGRMRHQLVHVPVVRSRELLAEVPGPADHVDHVTAVDDLPLVPALEEVRVLRDDGLARGTYAHLVEQGLVCCGPLAGVTDVRDA